MLKSKKGSGYISHCIKKLNPEIAMWMMTNHTGNIVGIIRGNLIKNGPTNFYSVPACIGSNNIPLYFCSDDIFWSANLISSNMNLKALIFQRKNTRGFWKGHPNTVLLYPTRCNWIEQLIGLILIRLPPNYTNKISTVIAELTF